MRSMVDADSGRQDMGREHGHDHDPPIWRRTHKSKRDKHAAIH